MSHHSKYQVAVVCRPVQIRLGFAGEVKKMCYVDNKPRMLIVENLKSVTLHEARH